MIKLQQYYIYKINTNYLKRNDYQIELNIDQARQSGLIISLADSQMLRSLRKIKGYDENHHEKIQDIILNHNPHAIKDLLKYMNNEKKKQYRYLLDSEELGLL